MYIDKAADYVGQVQTIHGWIYNSRSSGKVAFVLVRDGTGIMQCVVAKSGVDDSTFESVTARGTAPGRIDGADQFDANGDCVEVPALNLATNRAIAARPSLLPPSYTPWPE